MHLPAPRRLALVLALGLGAGALVTAAGGCSIVFDDTEDEQCVIPAIAPAPQRNPETLTCETYGGYPCDPACGPCPLDAPAIEPAPAIAPAPTWGICGSPCEGLAEPACAAAPECRVVKIVACRPGQACTGDYFGCLPTDQAASPAVDCYAARDGWTCSRSAACTAYHREVTARAALAPETPAPRRDFATCAPEAAPIGSCAGPVTCRAAAPSCPPAHVPAIAAGCYTGGCLPVDVCGPAEL